MAATTTTETMTLADFANETEYPVLFWVSVGAPTGELAPLCHPDLRLAEERGWLYLEGTVGGDGRWSWDGKGNARDMLQNSITSLAAYPDRAAWESLVREWEEG